MTLSVEAVYAAAVFVHVMSLTATPWRSLAAQPDKRASLWRRELSFQPFLAELL